MKKVVLSTIMFFLYLPGFAQIICGEIEEPIQERENSNIAYGGSFTPKGDLRMLIVFVKYGGIYDTMYLEGWNNGDFPDWAMSSNEAAFYHDYSDFPNSIFSDTNRKSVSNFYYQMSGGQFRLIADYYPDVITLSPIPNEARGDFHKRVLAQIPSSFDWKPYDNRINNPDYSNDYSYYSPDNIVDYVIFCHRYYRRWPSSPHNWTWYDGEAHTGFSQHAIPNANNMDAHEGFSYMSGWMEPMGIFPHEVGHTLYSAPHYSGNNSVCGDYFYEPIAGWGMMRLDHNYTCAAGWERYLLNWVPDIKANGVNANIENASDLSANNGLFLLRDFITTGDVIRIRVPAGDENYQYVWLENHQCKSTFDGNMHGDSFCTTPIDEYKRGLIAYVESYSHAKDIGYENLFNNGNGIR